MTPIPFREQNITYNPPEGIWQTQRTRPVRPDGFFASVMKQKIAYSMTSSRLILNLPCAVTLCRPFLSKRKLSPAFSS